MRGVQGSSLIKKKDNSPAKFRLITTHCCSVVGINQKKKTQKGITRKVKQQQTDMERRKGFTKLGV